MLKWLITTSLRLRVLIVALMTIILIVGLNIVRQTPMDVFPEFAPPYVEVQTEVPGLSTAEVEALVTIPIENALNGTSWAEKIRSKSVMGLSSVVLFFNKDVDINAARQMVQEKLTLAAESLPAVAKPPLMLHPLSATSRALKIGISSETLDQMGMTALAKWIIRPRLVSIPGVANVAIWGERDRQLQVLVLQAMAYQAAGEDEQAVQRLGEALALASPGGLIRIFVDEGAPMADLLSQMAAGNPGFEFAQKLLAVFERDALPKGTFLPAATQPLIEPLSEREQEVLRLIAEGLSNREIGERLFLALNTVKGYNRKIFYKLQVQRRTEAIARARELGLL